MINVVPSLASVCLTAFSGVKKRAFLLS